jgi:hypothetical protein
VCVCVGGLRASERPLIPRQRDGTAGGAHVEACREHPHDRDGRQWVGSAELIVYVYCACIPPGPVYCACIYAARVYILRVCIRCMYTVRVYIMRVYIYCPCIPTADSGSGPLTFVGEGKVVVIDVHDLGWFRSAAPRTARARRGRLVRRAVGHCASLLCD